MFVFFFCSPFRNPGRHARSAMKHHKLYQFIPSRGTGNKKVTNFFQISGETFSAGERWDRDCAIAGLPGFWVSTGAHQRQRAHDHWEDPANCHYVDGGAQLQSAVQVDGVRDRVPPFAGDYHQREHGQHAREDGQKTGDFAPDTCGRAFGTITYDNIYISTAIIALADVTINKL